MTSTRGHLPAYRMRAVHLTAIWAYGVSQPMFSIMGGNPELLVAQNATRLDAVVVVLFVALVPPLAATAYAWLAGRVSRWVGDIVYLALFGAFLIPLVLQLEKHFEPSARTALLVAGTTGLGGVVLYARYRAVRLFVGFSVFLPIVGLLLFARGLSPVTGEAHASSRVAVRTPHPVVMVVLDEFPVSSLMTTRGAIDAGRYPNFARLAREGTWYPNATTVHDSTQGATPAILTGVVERMRDLPIAFNYPKNLFALLGEEYALDVHEASTRMCPRSYCPQYEASFVERVTGLARRARWLYIVRTMPESILPTFRDVDFERVQGGRMNETLKGFEGLLSGISPNEPRRTFHFAHVLVPHSPWRYFPSGTEYNFDGRDGLVNRHHWAQEPWPSLQAQQQHLLQVAFTDVQLGRLLDRLDRTGLYDDALLVVLADHGISFRPGASHRWTSPENILDISNIPLFVKYPHQQRGVVDPRAARVVDVVPTLADVLGIALPWKADGESLRGDPPHRTTISVTGRGGEVVRAELTDMVRRRAAVVRRKTAYFGEGRESLFRLGTRVDLLGTAAPEPLAAVAIRVQVDNRGALASVERSSGFLPAKIAGVVENGRLEPGTELAVAVNGRIRAVTRPIEWEGDQVFNALVPEASFRDGFNRVDVYAVETVGSTRRLVWLGSNAHSG